MTPPQPQPATGSSVSRAEVGRDRAPGTGAGPFVINLCSSTTPMALEQPKLAELKQRFTFFVSRRREDGRERFRLHMGYFETEAEAEELLAVVRDFYPGAWVGEAPGKRLREREAAAAAASAAPSSAAPLNGATQPPPHVLAGISKLQGSDGKGRPTAARSAPISARSDAARLSDDDSEVSVTFEPAPMAVATSSPQPDLAPIMLASLPASAPDAARSALVAASASAQAAMRMASPPPVLVVPTLQGAPEVIPPLAAIPTLSANIPTVSAPAAPTAAVNAAPTAAAVRNVAATAAAVIAQNSPAVRGADVSVPAAVSTPVRPTANGPVVGAVPPVAKAAGAKAPLPVAKSAAPVAKPLGPVSKVANGSKAAPAHARAPIAAGSPAAKAVQPAKSAQPAKVAAKAPAARTPAAPARANAPSAPAKSSTNALSNVREVLASLDAPAADETGQTRQMPALAAQPAASDSSLTDTQVLKYLEVRRSDGSTRESPDGDGISLLRPDDTGTVRALKDAVTSNAPVSFAVQLKFAVQPIELSEVPPLAIFSAYTLYTVEGSREGRKWFGLRLGFFSDAISAKQVAQYVRSEFASVAVVPVSPQERDRATDAGQGARTAASLPQKKHTPAPVDEFKLIDTMETPVLKKQVTPPAPAPAPKAAAPAPKAPAKPIAPAANATVKRGSKSTKVRARDRKSPQSLEETLEILGADQLEIDNGRGEVLNDTGVRHLKVRVQKNSPFTRLLDRLSERVGKS